MIFNFTIIKVVESPNCGNFTSCYCFDGTCQLVVSEWAVTKQNKVSCNHSYLTVYFLCWDKVHQLLSNLLFNQRSGINITILARYTNVYFGSNKRKPFFPLVTNLCGMRSIEILLFIMNPTLHTSFITKMTVEFNR